MSTAQNIQSHPVVVQTRDKANYYVSQLDKELSKYSVFNTFEARTQIPKSYAFIAGAALLMLFHSVNILAAPTSNLVGWALPAYLSVKALESPGHQDDVQWLTYWVVFGFFNFLESFALSVVLYYFPWYFVFKSAFIVWLQLPAFRGAQSLYGTVVRPIFVNVHQKTTSAASTTTASYDPTTTAASAQ